METKEEIMSIVMITPLFLLGVFMYWVGMVYVPSLFMVLIAIHIMVNIMIMIKHTRQPCEPI